MNTLVLGGNGFIGSHLVDKLLVNGHRVKVYDRCGERFRKPLAQVEYFMGDFGNRGLLIEALQDVDIVYHLISTSLPKTSNDDPVYDVQSNVIESLFLLEQCVSRGIKKIIFTSSGGTVYGKPVTLPISEDAFTDPECSYGITKLTIEKYLSLFHHLYGLNYTIVRPSNPYGTRQNPTGIQGAIPVFLGKIARNEPIEIWGDGSVVRDYIYVTDLVEAIYKASFINNSAKIFNIGSGVGHSLNEILYYLRIVCCREFEVVYKEKRSFDVPEIYLDITKAKRDLCWEPVVEIKDGIRHTWKFISSLGSNIV